METSILSVEIQKTWKTSPEFRTLQCNDEIGIFYKCSLYIDGMFVAVAWGNNKKDAKRAVSRLILEEYEIKNDQYELKM